MRKSLFMVVWFIGLHGLALCASASDLTPEYLQGRWVIDFENCESPDAEYVLFREDGAFESIRTGKTEIVGFWHLSENVLDLHMVTSPAFFADVHDAMAGFEGIYSYFEGRMVLFNPTKERFDAVAIFNTEVRKATAVRCK